MTQHAKLATISTDWSVHQTYTQIPFCFKSKSLICFRYTIDMFVHSSMTKPQTCSIPDDLVIPTVHMDNCIQKMASLCKNYLCAVTFLFLHCDLPKKMWGKYTPTKSNNIYYDIYHGAYTFTRRQLYIYDIIYYTIYTSNLHNMPWKGATKKIRWQRVRMQPVECWLSCVYLSISSFTSPIVTKSWCLQLVFKENLCDGTSLWMILVPKSLFRLDVW